MLAKIFCSKNISIAGVNAYFELSQVSGGFPLVKLKTGHPLSYRFTQKNSNIVMLTAGLNSNFGSWYNSNLIYPLLYQAVLYNSSKSNIAFNANDLGKYSVVRNMQTDAPIKVWYNNEGFIPRQENQGPNVVVLLDEQFQKNGFFTVTQNRDTLGLIAVNAPNLESEIDFWNKGEISQFKNWRWLEGDATDINRSVSELIYGTKYWKHCLLLALLFLLFEVLILRFLKSI